MTEIIAQKCSEGNIGTSELFEEPDALDGKFQTRAWVFTAWDAEKPVFLPAMKYLLFSPEVCPDTGKHHWQGFVVWKSQKSLKACVKNLKVKTHPWVGVAKKGVEFQLPYIMGPYDDGKGKTKPYNEAWEEFGDRPAQGTRVDLHEIRDRIKDGARVDELLIENPMMYHMYGRTLLALEDVVLRAKSRTKMTKGIWLYGKTGTGKSHEAFKNYDASTHYLWSNDKGWWDAYAQQGTVIMNDYRGEIPYNFLLQLVDKWPCVVSRRGREPIPFTSETVVITSSLHPSDIYKNRAEEDSLEQLYRRFEIVEMLACCMPSDEDMGSD